MARRKPAKRIDPTFDDEPKRGRKSAMRGTSDNRSSQRRVRKNGRGGSRRRGSRSRKKRSLFRLLRKATYWAVVLSLWAGIGLAGLFAWYGAKMPSATSWAIPDRPPNVRIVAVDGQLLANRGMMGGEAVGLHEMPAHLAEAVIAIEDRRFYSHFGVDPVGIGRAMVTNLMHGRFAQGGSTITQQLAKNLFLKPERTIERKVQEVLLAFWLEHEYTKNQILEMYLNRVYFGSGAYGVQAAAQRYFNKPVGKLDLAESAVLAGLLKAPSRLSPARDANASEERAQIVLAAMREQNLINDGEMTEAISSPAVRAPSYWTGAEHYVADLVMERLPSLIGEISSDIVVETTINRDLQKRAEKVLRNVIRENRKSHVSQGAVVSINNSGAVRVMVGGADYSRSQFNRVSDARRQPGSAFKPFVFLAALENGLTPSTVRYDTPVRIGRWTPENYKGKYHGAVTLSEALAGSYNSVAARLIAETGPRQVVKAAYRLGIESPLSADPTIALGTSEVTPLELTAAFVPFSNGGFKPKIHFIREIRSVDGTLLYRHDDQPGPRVLKPEIVGMMNTMMTETVRSGTARRAGFGYPAAGKTGTTQMSRDAWFIGYTAHLTTGVWLGNDDNSPMKNVTGGSLPAAAWNEVMAAAHAGLQPIALPGNSEWHRSVAAALQSAGQSDRGVITNTTPRPSGEVGQSNRANRTTSILDIIFSSR